jgi:FixJ family two-component response regulator
VAGMTAMAKTKLVAVVDDDELVRMSLQRLLKAAGLTVSAFASAEDFLMSSQLEAAGCLITDIRMPGMSGLELQAKLKAEQSKVPIIFVTAHDDGKMRMQAMCDGAVEFLRKPFDDEALLETVRAALEG